MLIRRTPIVLLLCLALMAPTAAGTDLVQAATQYRYEGMCQWASGKPPQWLLGYANRPENWGKQPFNLVYNEWFHVLKRGANNLGRQGNFYQALCGLIVLEAEFDKGSAELLKQQVDYWEGVRLAVAQGKNAVGLIAAAEEDPLLKAILGATDREISTATAGENMLTVFAYLKAAEADSKALMLAPVVSANHSIGIIEAIKASTGDGDIVRACEGVLRELRDGREDYISRLHNLAVNGQLSSLLASAAAKGSISLGVSTLLSGLGMQATAGTIGTIAGSAFAAFVGGMQIGFWLTGETAAYEHARLAHFAAYMQPGLGERWFALKDRVNPREPDTCAEFDATTRALILLNGYVNQETDYMAQCYANAVVKFGFWKRTTALPMDGYQRNYASWNSGELFQARGAGRPGDRPGTRAGQTIVGPRSGLPITSLQWVWVPPGEFMMGSQAGQGEGPVHRVRTTKGFWLSKCEITNAQYAAFLNAHGSLCDGSGQEMINLRSTPRCRVQQVDGAWRAEAGWENHPVFQVTWYGAKAYCDHYGLRLPTEAEWEYAARGPEARAYPWGNEWDGRKCVNGEDTHPRDRSYVYPRTRPVGSIPAGDSWCGASDMAGNVSEWCADWWDAEYYARSPASDPAGPASGDSRVLRGGSWLSGGFWWVGYHCRSAHRGWLCPIALGAEGFRPARTQ